MKILHLLKSTDYSGAENVVISIMQHCTENEMVYASPNGAIKEIVQGNGLTFYTLKAVNIRSIRQAIKEVKPDIIHAHDFSMSTFAAFSTHRIPVIAHLHNNPLWTKKVCYKTLSFLLSVHRIKKIITVSPAVEEDFIFSQIFASKIIVLGNVVDVGKIRGKSEEICETEQSDIIFLGRLTQQKQPLLFCQIIREIQKKIPNIKAIMIGEGNLKAETEKYILENNLSENIKLLGFKENPYVYLKNSKLLIMPSAWEGFGLVAVEALSLGKPVVCSGAGGLCEIVDETCGAVCKSTNEYVEAVLKIMCKSSEYRRASDGSIVKAEQFCDWDGYIEKLFKIYSNV